MELWNKNDEFRKEYLRCNTRSTLRRFRTSDGRALGPDEEPVLLPIVVDKIIDRSVSTSDKGNTQLLTVILEQEKLVPSMAGQETDAKSTANVAEQTDQTVKTQKPGKHLRTLSATFSGRAEIEEMAEEEPKQTKEQQELARKEEELRKEEAVAKLKEQRRLEEKAKAQEALERKRRNAEKAQIRAELRAQKEAEQKEKVTWFHLNFLMSLDSFFITLLITMKKHMWTLAIN